MAVTQSIVAVGDLIKETTTGTGSGTLNVAGAVSGFQTIIGALGDYATFYYHINGGAQWEIGWGRIVTGTLYRNVVLASSDSGALISFNAGTKIITCVNPAEIIRDSMKQVHSGQTTDATQTTLTVHGMFEYEQFIPTDTTVAVHATIVARQTAGSAGTVGDSFTVKQSALFKNISDTGSLVAGPNEIADSSHKDAAFGGSVTMDANATDVTMRIKVTGEANKTIEWKAYVELFEVE